MKHRLNRILLLVYMAVYSVSGSLFGQANQDNSSTNSLDHLPRERVFLHTDKPYYLTGETLWFKAYCVETDNGTPTYLSSVLYVELLDKDQKPVAQLKSSLSSGTATGQLLMSPNWSTGTYILRAYTAWMRNGNEADFYHQPISIVNPLSVLSPEMYSDDSISTADSERVEVNNEQSHLIEIQSDYDTYTFRQPISLKLVPDESINSAIQVSVAVYPYHAALENMNSGLDYSSINSKSKSNSESGIQYFAETVGPVLYGQAEQANPLGLKLSLKGQATRVYTPVFLDSINFAVQLPRTVDYQDLFFWSSKQDSVSVIINPEFDVRSNDLNSSFLSFDQSTVEFIEGQSLNMQVSNLYQEYNQIHGRPDTLNKLSVPFYGSPDFRYDLDDYTRFPELEEVFREFVTKVSIRKKAGTLQLFVWDQYSNNRSIANNIFFEEPALVLVDGMPVSNLDRLMEVDPLRFKSIEGINKRYLIGDEEFHGIVNLISYKEDFSGREPFFNIELVNRSGIDQTYYFYHPDHGSASERSRIPDRRNTLYWNNQITISNKIEELLFYAADVAGSYHIVVKGQTADGRLVEGSKMFTVKERTTP